MKLYMIDVSWELDAVKCGMEEWMKRRPLSWFGHVENVRRDKY